MADPQPQAEETEVPETDELDDTVETEEPESEETESEDEPAAAAAADEPEAPEPEQPQKPQSRAARRIQSLNDELKTVRSELAQIRQERQRPDPMAQAEAERRAKAEEDDVLASLDPVRISRFYSDRNKRETDQRFQQLAVGVADQTDRTNFAVEAQGNPLLQSVSDRVEERLAQLRAQGLNPQRRALAAMMLGEDLLKRGPAARTRQQTRAAAQVARQTVRPSRPSGDVSSPARRGAKNSRDEVARRLDESGRL